MRGSGSFRKRGSVLPLVGGDPVLFFRTAVFTFLHYTALLWRSQGTNQHICFLLYALPYAVCTSTWSVCWLVCGWRGLWVGVSCGTLVSVVVRVGGGHGIS